MTGTSVLAPFTLLTSACGGITTLSADFQVDVIGASLSDTDTIRVCATPGVSKEEAMGHGRLAVAGLGHDGITVQIQHSESGAIAGQTDPVVLESRNPWVEVPWKQCTDDCRPCTSKRSPNFTPEDGALLVVNFTD